MMEIYKSQLEGVPSPLTIENLPDREIITREGYENILEIVEEIIKLPPNFDPLDPKWQEGNFVEWVAHVRTTESTVELRQEIARKTLNEFVDIVRIIEKHVGRLKVSEEMQKIIDHSGQDLDEDTIERQTQIVIENLKNDLKKWHNKDEEVQTAYRKKIKDSVEEKSDQRQKERQQATWVSGVLGVLGQNRWLRKGFTVIGLVLGLGLQGETIPHQKSAELEDESAEIRQEELEARQSRRHLVVDDGMGVHEEEKKETAPTQIERKEVAGGGTLELSFEHSPKFEFDETEIDENEIAKIVKKLQGLLRVAQKDLKDIKVVITSETPGVSARFRFDKKRGLKRNIALGQQRQEATAKPIQESIEQALPGVPIEFVKNDAYFTIEGKTYSHEDAVEYIRQLAGFNKDTRGDKALYTLFKQFEEKGTAGISPKIVPVLTALTTEARKVRFRITIEGTRVENVAQADINVPGKAQERRRPRQGIDVDFSPTPSEEKSGPEPASSSPDEEKRMKLIQEKTIHEKHHADEFNRDNTGQLYDPEDPDNLITFAKINEQHQKVTEVEKKTTRFEKILRKVFQRRKRRLIDVPPPPEPTTEEMMGQTVSPTQGFRATRVNPEDQERKFYHPQDNKKTNRQADVAVSRTHKRSGGNIVKEGEHDPRFVERQKGIKDKEVIEEHREKKAKEKEKKRFRNR